MNERLNQIRLLDLDDLLLIYLLDKGAVKARIAEYWRLAPPAISYKCRKLARLEWKISPENAGKAICVLIDDDDGEHLKALARTFSL